MDAVIAWLIQCGVDLGKSFAWYGAAAFAIHMAERRWPAGPLATFSEQRFNFVLAFLVAFSTTAINTVAPVASIITGARDPLLAGWIPDSPAGWIAGALLYAFVWDFFQYWFHFLQHRVRPLWFMHALHHDSRALNATDALRATFWSLFFQGLFIGIPVVMLGVHLGLHSYAGLLLFSTWGFYNHANLRVSHGPLTAVLSGPQYHRIHHDADPAYHDKNFAAFFPVIDIVFGTYQAPVPGRVPATGLSDRPQSRGGLLAVVAATFGVRAVQPDITAAEATPARARAASGSI